MKYPCPRPRAGNKLLPRRDKSSLNVSYKRKKEGSLEDWGGDGSHLEEQTLALAAPDER
jgi:hypothetical protein